MAVPSRADRILLAASYVLLVAIVAWLGWDVDRRVAEVRETVCVSSYSVLSTLEIAVIEDLTEEEAQGLIDVFAYLDESCGEVNLPNE